MGRQEQENRREEERKDAIKERRRESRANKETPLSKGTMLDMWGNSPQNHF